RDENYRARPPQPATRGLLHVRLLKTGGWDMLGTRFAAALTFASFCVVSAAHAADGTPAYIANALKNPLRPPLAIAHDPVRKPAEMMAFAGVKPGMNVAEILPQGGYYTRILAGIVGKQGAVYTIVPQGPGGQGTQSRRGPMVKDENQNSEIDRVNLAFTVA